MGNCFSSSNTHGPTSKHKDNTIPESITSPNNLYTGNEAEKVATHSIGGPVVADPNVLTRANTDNLTITGRPINSLNTTLPYLPEPDVRDGDTVKHYRIRQLDEGGFFIARRTTFRTLQDLVEHYSKDADGLCVNLRKPCIQIEKPVTEGLSHSTP
ncbi:Tyrosine-protein kinase Src42A [Armadillidium nasatum]|uniref:Tyrosine-protein kinase Src42A n=1 Tax=Armadillidium nasatum TaxID=96803 RepID=A0A5N5SL09_9CRUS|nr:Tyrosine-protein kinase Src42A [Armadillidium nasatum]